MTYEYIRKKMSENMDRLTKHINEKSMQKTNYVSLLWQKIQGKKTTIMAVVGAITVFGIGRGYIEQDTGELISTLMVILGGTANYVNYKLKK